MILRENNAGEEHAGTQGWLRQEVMHQKIAGGTDATFGGTHCTVSISGRNAGKDRAGTQGWPRPRQVAMPGETSGDARLPSAGGNKARFSLSADQHYVEGQRSAVLREVRQLQVSRCML